MGVLQGGGQVVYSPMMRSLIEMNSVGLFILAVGTGQPEWQGSGTNE